MLFRLCAAFSSFTWFLHRLPYPSLLLSCSSPISKFAAFCLWPLGLTFSGFPVNHRVHAHPHLNLPPGEQNCHYTRSEKSDRRGTRAVVWRAPPRPPEIRTETPQSTLLVTSSTSSGFTHTFHHCLCERSLSCEEKMDHVHVVVLEFLLKCWQKDQLKVKPYLCREVDPHLLEDLSGKKSGWKWVECAV